MLTGPEVRPVRVLHSHPSWAYRSSVQQEGPKPFLSYVRNMVSPYRSRQGSGVVRYRDDDTGMGWGKKRRPGCNGPDTGCNITRRESGQTSPWSSVTREFGQTARRESR
jgi:hypothetical protein